MWRELREQITLHVRFLKLDLHHTILFVFNSLFDCLDFLNALNSAALWWAKRHFFFLSRFSSNYWVMLTKTSGWSQFGIHHLLGLDLLLDKYLDKSDSYRKKHCFLDCIWCGNWGEEYHVNKHGISPGRPDNPSSPHTSIHHFTHILFSFIFLFKCFRALNNEFWMLVTIS